MSLYRINNTLGGNKHIESKLKRRGSDLMKQMSEQPVQRSGGGGCGAGDGIEMNVKTHSRQL